MDGVAPALTERGTTLCRGCGGQNLVSVLDLGVQPVSNDMSPVQEGTDPLFPLHLRICPACGLGQLGEFLLPEQIFAYEYPYQSSVSASWVAHAGRYVEAMHSHLGLTADDLVVEIASNDGYLLTQMQDSGPRVLGVEPSGGVADIARARGVETLGEFFGVALAEKIVATYGRPRLVVANNVLAHVPDMADFLGGIAHLCDERTIVTVENPAFTELMAGAQFDTIYHEHFSYLTAHAVAVAAARVGLELIRVDPLTTHGGSNRYWLALHGVHAADSSVRTTVAAELAAGLLSPQRWESFARSSHEAIEGLREWLDARRSAGAVVAGYGAAAKGNTLLNAAGVTYADVLMVVDSSTEKQGKFMPGSRIPVAAPAELTAADPDDILILPWNIAEELTGLAHEFSPRSRIWAAIPVMRQLS